MSAYLVRCGAFSRLNHFVNNFLRQAANGCLSPVGRYDVTGCSLAVLAYGRTKATRHAQGDPWGVAFYHIYRLSFP